MKKKEQDHLSESSTDIGSSEVKRQTHCALTQESFYFSAEIYSLCYR